MLFITRIAKRRSLRPVIRTLPHSLMRRYGKGNFYTVGQVLATARALNLKSELLAPAGAVACSPEEFLKADPLITQHDYAAIRTEISQLFLIELSDLNCRSLIDMFRSSVGVENPFSPNTAVTSNIVNDIAHNIDGSSS